MSDDPAGRLIPHLAGSCTCDTKSPDRRAHDQICRYRALLEIIDYVNELRSQLAAARAEGMEAAAKCAEQFGDRILHMWERPGGPPGNGYRALRGADVAAAIRALAQEPGE